MECVEFGYIDKEHWTSVVIKPQHITSGPHITSDQNLWARLHDSCGFYDHQYNAVTQSVYWQFSKEEDAVLFKLKFG